jgi:endo-1,4-beta-xylanase
MTHPAGGLPALKTAAAIKAEIQNEKTIHDQLLPTQHETMLRPPEGQYNATVATQASSLGLTVVTWTLDTKDWEDDTSTAEIVAVAGAARDQDIVLMHDGYRTTLTAIPQIVAKLRAAQMCPGKIVKSTTSMTNEWGEQEYVKVEAF